MRQISEIRKLTGGRYLVVLDDGICFPLYEKELHEYNIHEEEYLMESVFQEIMEEVLPKRAKLRAMHLLEKMDRTEYQLRMKLQEMSYPEEIVTEAIAYVKKYRYVDDLRYAISYMEYRRESKSLRQLEQELYQKGISKEIFQEAAEQLEEPNEEQQILQLLQKKHYQPGVTEQKEKDRIFRFLLRRGYNISAVRHAMQEDSLYE